MNSGSKEMGFFRDPEMDVCGFRFLLSHEDLYSFEVCINISGADLPEWELDHAAALSGVINEQFEQARFAIQSMLRVTNYETYVDSFCKSGVNALDK